MTLIEKLETMDEEKAFRSRIYISGQLRQAKKIDGFPTVYDLCNSRDEFEFMIITKKYWFTPSIADPDCNSPLIDGDWGWYNADETAFFPFVDYGETWIAAPYAEIAEEEGWPKLDEIQKLLK